MFIGVLLASLLVKTAQCRELGRKGACGASWGMRAMIAGGSHLHIDGRSLRSLRTAGKEMARAHGVDPHQCKS